MATQLVTLCSSAVRLRLPFEFLKDHTFFNDKIVFDTVSVFLKIFEL